MPFQFWQNKQVNLAKKPAWVLNMWALDLRTSWTANNLSLSTFFIRCMSCMWIKEDFWLYLGTMFDLTYVKSEVKLLLSVGERLKFQAESPSCVTLWTPQGFLAHKYPSHWRSCINILRFFSTCPIYLPPRETIITNVRRYIEDNQKLRLQKPASLIF